MEIRIVIQTSPNRFLYIYIERERPKIRRWGGGEPEFYSKTQKLLGGRN